MTQPDLIQMLRQTFEDKHLSRAEKQAVRDLIQDAARKPGGLGDFRQKSFKVAREALPSQHHITLNWLEDMVKLMLNQTKVQKAAGPEAFFSPGGDCLNQICKLFDQAHRTVDICVFTITDNRIVQKIRDAKRRGVKIRIISDNDKALDLGSDIEHLHQFGLPVRTDQTDKHMHHKFAIFDGDTLLTGSYNWTRAAAAANEENVVILKDKGVIRAFQNEFDSLWPNMTPFK